MIGALLVAGGAALFKGAFPEASVLESPNKVVTSASGFEARGLGDTPEEAARAFLGKHGRAFGVGPRQRLAVAPTTPPGTTVRFQRRVDGLPVFDGDIIVGTKDDGTIIVVNTSDVPAKVTGKPRISRKAAIKSAEDGIPDLKTSGAPRAERGWRAAGQSIRPVWRVDFVAVRPAADFRSYVDAETGKVLFRMDRRKTGAPAGLGPPKMERAADAPR